MKKILILIWTLFVGVAIAETINVNWYVGDSVYDTSTCTVGGDIILPTAPTKRGYTFRGWNAYTSIEYIKSIGGQYIDTGIEPNNNTIVKVKFNAERASSFIFGTRWSSAPKYGTFGLYINSSGYASLQFGDAGISDIKNIGEALNTDTTIVLDIDKIVKNGTEYSIQRGSITPHNLTIYMFADNQSGMSESTVGKIYYMQIFENNTLVRDFIPVLDANGVACMFDKVTMTFFYNSGTGEFLAGPAL